MLPDSMKDRTIHLAYSDLLEELHVKEVHYSTQPCPKSCKQKESCKCFREVLVFLKYLMKEVSKKYSIFSNTEIVLVGSLKESTKIGELDEADCLLLKKKYEENLYFDEESQRIKFWNKNTVEDLEPFRTDDNTFDSKKYFFTFLSSIYSVLSVQGEEIPAKLNLSMDPMRTKYVPCKRCMTMDYQGAHTKRCFHKPGCDHRDNCGCDQYTSPCISFTKVKTRNTIKIQTSN